MNSKTNTLYVANNDGTVSVISGRTNKVTAKIHVASTTRGVATNSRTNTIYATNSGFSDFTVSVINGRTNKVTARVHVGRIPVGVAVNSRTNRVYVGNGHDNTVSVLASCRR